MAARLIACKNILADASHREGIVSLGAVLLNCGATLPEVRVAYCTYGTLDPSGCNTILVTHGYTASHHMLAHGAGVAEGSWAGLIGPGKPLDTRRWFIVCSNMLGSSYGSTGPASIDPRTGHPYGPDFPQIGFTDIVQVQKRLLERLGVCHLHAVVGPSYGGFQALQWGLDHPQWVERLGIVLSAAHLPAHEQMDVDQLSDVLRRDPGWRGGRYADPAALHGTLFTLRRENLMAHGTLEVLAAQGLAPQERMAELERQAWGWARQFDANSMLCLLKAGRAFDVRPRLHELRGKVLQVLCTTDTLFPPGHGCALTQVPQLRYAELDSPFGHQASGAAHAQWAPLLRELLDARGAGRG